MSFVDPLGVPADVRHSDRAAVDAHLVALGSMIIEQRERIELLRKDIAERDNAIAFLLEAADQRAKDLEAAKRGEAVSRSTNEQNQNKVRAATRQQVEREMCDVVRNMLKGAEMGAESLTEHGISVPDALKVSIAAYERVLSKILEHDVPF